MRILVLLISSSLFCKGITITTDGLGSDQNWNIKSQTGNGNVTINVNDDNEFSIDDNSDSFGTFDNEKEPWWDRPNKPHTPQNEDGSFNYSNDDSNSANSVLGESDDSPTPLPSGSKVDTDDDVPTLLSIRSRVHSLQQELTKQAIDTRGTTSVITNFDTNDYEHKEVELADLYNVLREIIPDNADEKQEFEDKKTENEEKIEEFTTEFESEIENLKDTTEDFTSITINEPSVGNNNNDFTRFELDIGTRSFYLDPLKDVYTGGISVGYTWKDISSWIMLVIGLFAVFIYWRACLNMTKDMAQTMIESQMTSPVTSLEIFGNSVGTLVMMGIKITIMVTLVLGIVGNTALVLLEADINIVGLTGTPDQMVNQITSAISGSNFAWASFAVELFFDLVPVLSIISMVTSYWGQKMLMWLLMLVAYVSCKIST